MNKVYLFLCLFINNLFTQFNLLKAFVHNILLKSRRNFNKKGTN
jgi:hypothetical protein